MAPSVLIWSTVRIYRDGLAAALEADARLGPVEVIADGDLQLPSVEADPSRVVVIDARSSRAVDFARGVADQACGVVAMGLDHRAADVVALAQAGVGAYLTREQPLEDLIGAILTVSRGDAVCGPSVTALLLEHVASGAARPRVQPGERALTRREREILDRIRAGLSNKQIAAELSIELTTVKNHVHNVLAKLGASTRLEAAAMSSAFPAGARP